MARTGRRNRGEVNHRCRASERQERQALDLFLVDDIMVSFVPLGAFSKAARRVTTSPAGF
jgi:hypothetical protein